MGLICAYLRFIPFMDVAISKRMGVVSGVWGEVANNYCELANIAIN